MKKFFFIAYSFSVFFFLFFKIKPAFSASIYSDAGILMNMDTQEIILSKNEHKSYLTASIAKIMTCIIAIEEVDLKSIVVIEKEDLLQEGSKIYLQEKEKVYMEDLLYGLLLRSGNDAAYAIAKYVGKGDVNKFVKLMNKKAKFLKMNNTVFQNPSGLDDQNENISTPYDMAILMCYCANNPFFKAINNTKTHKFKTLDGNNYVFLNKHRLINKQTNYDGGKTGYTKKAGRTLITTFTKDNVRLVVVTFKGSSDFNEHEALFKLGYEKLSNSLYLKKQLFLYQEQYETLYLYLNEDIFINKLKYSKVTSKIEYENGNYLLKIINNEDIIFIKTLVVIDFLADNNEILFDYIKEIL